MHSASVFLAGDRAYKLKKPLVLPFLDYGTAERRHEMCREEVRLNRRLAPDVYLGVRAVAGIDEGLELAEEDDPRAVDYLVEMRRYDERSTLAAKLERGELRRGEVAQLARRLAQFHARARRVAATGVPVLAVERRMTENFHELLAIVEQRAEVGWVLELERFVHAFVAAHAQMLDARARRDSYARATATCVPSTSCSEGRWRWSIASSSTAGCASSTSPTISRSS